MNNFDLNIGNYKKDELEEIFTLPPGKYDVQLVETKCAQLRNNIVSDASVDESIRKKTIIFLEEAKNLLVSELNSSQFLKKLGTAYNINHDLQSTPVIEAGETFIIDKPKTSFGNSYPSEFYPGIINPLKKRTTRQNLNIDTRFRDNYYGSSSSNFHFDLPIKFSDVMQVQLSSFEMPFTYYNISKQMGNNFFSITLDSDPTVPVIITVPDGNYTPVNLVAYLNNFVIGTSLNGKIQFIYNLYAANNGTGQLVIGTVAPAPGVPEVGAFTLTFNSDIYGNADAINPLPLKLGWMLGFRNGSYSGNNNYVGEGLIDLNGPKYVYLVVDDYNNNVNNNFYSAFNSSILNKNILARISFQPNLFRNLSQDNLALITTPRQYFGPVDIQKLKIQLLDEYGRVIDMNNMDYSFCLTFTSVYDI
jgi:hypothetical protein